MKIKITLSQAIEGFNLAKRAEQLSPHTLADYNTTFRKLVVWWGDLDPYLDEVTTDDLREFLDGMSRKTIHPRGIAPRPPRKLSRKSILNIHTGISALWAWALAEGYVDTHIVRQIRVAKPEPPAIMPLSQDDVVAMLEACDYTREYQRPGQVSCRHTRLTAERDKLIIKILLDTGLRVSELCDLTIGDVDLKNRRLRVMGKGSKERLVPIGSKLAKAMWRYLATRPAAKTSEPFLVDGQNGEYALSRHAVARLLRRIGDRAGVSGVHPHKFRHTFAITYLRNGGQEMALMRTLGHTNMTMTSRYARQAQADIERNHRDASPLDNWDL